MQRLHVDDLAGILLEAGGWEHLNLPAIAEEDQRVQVSKTRWHDRKLGALLHPERLGIAVLDGLKKNLGSLDYSAQYQQSPAPTEGNLIKRSWFREFYPGQGQYRQMTIVQSWDTAMKGNPTNDYSVCVTIAQNGQNYYVLDVTWRRMTYPELLDTAMDGKRTIVQRPCLSKTVCPARA